MTSTQAQAAGAGARAAAGTTPPPSPPLSSLNGKALSPHAWTAMKAAAEFLGVDQAIGAQFSVMPTLNLSTIAATGSAIGSLNARVTEAAKFKIDPVENKEASPKEVAPSASKSRYKMIEKDPKKGVVKALETLFHKLYYSPPKDESGKAIFEVFLERGNGLFSYKEIHSYFDELFPAKEHQSKRTLIETYVCEFVEFLRKETGRLYVKYERLYTEVTLFFAVSFQKLSSKTDIEDYRLFCTLESRKLRTILSGTDDQGRGIGLLQDLTRLEKLMIVCQSAPKNISEEIFRYILPNPLGGEPFVIQKSSKTSKSDYEKMTAFYENYEELLMINIHYVESLKNKILEIFCILNGFPGPYAEGVDHKLPEELRLLRHPKPAEKKAESKKEEPKTA